ncbi:MAG TPA: hypothetical protein VEN82_00060 [Actinomycetota bacterium]|nr:hypothetical protein [Actinomycetota bacterium]
MSKPEGGGSAWGPLETVALTGAARHVPPGPWLVAVLLFLLLAAPAVFELGGTAFGVRLGVRRRVRRPPGHTRPRV